MLSQNSAKRGPVGGAGRSRRLSFVGAIIFVGALGGCQPTGPLVVVTDPADPGAAVPRVAYRSAIAPYSSLRPTAPAPWRERNDAVSPKGEGSER